MKDPAESAGPDFPLEEQLQKHLPGLRAFVAGRVDRLVHAKESNADIVQSVCREVLEHIDRFEHRSEAGFKQWLYRTAERKIIDRYRYYTADKRDAGRELPPSASEPSTDGDLLAAALRDAQRGGPTPSHEAIAREELLRTSRAFEGLPPIYREVILLSRVHGVPHADIAKRLGKTEGAVRNLLYRGLGALTDRLAEGSAEAAAASAEARGERAARRPDETPPPGALRRRSAG
jgi:RNA polymerase sigma-70 factor (ECF subfamily)